MTRTLDVPVCRLSSPLPVSDYLTVQIDGKPWDSGQEPVFVSYGLYTITLMPKPGVSVPDKVKLVVDQPGWFALTPDVGQTLDPTKGATWNVRCGYTGAGVKTVINAWFDQLPSTRLDVPVWFQNGDYYLEFFKTGGAVHPVPETPITLKAGDSLQLYVSVRTRVDWPRVQNVDVLVAMPDFPDEVANTYATGIATPKRMVSYAQSGRLVEIIATTTQPSGQLSWGRLLIQII